jgi:methylmalonyl-CoA/ethylmalonyl-CoA epimerase
MIIEKIDHVGIMVEDVEKAQKFFEDVFGLKFVSIGAQEEADSKNIIDPVGIEIYEPLSSDGPSRRMLNKRGEGLSLLSLKVNNLDEAMAEMESHGIRLVKLLTRGNLRAAVYFPKDTFGVFIELIEYPEVHPAAPYFLEKGL